MPSLSVTSTRIDHGSVAYLKGHCLHRIRLLIISIIYSGTFVQDAYLHDSSTYSSMIGFQPQQTTHKSSTLKAAFTLPYRTQLAVKYRINEHAV